MKSRGTILALVTEAFGGPGGIAQYNRDLLRALAESVGSSPILVLPRGAPDRMVPHPARIVQASARRGRAAYSFAALRAVLGQSVDIVFCGHLYMASLAAAIAKVKQAKLVIQTHGIEAWRQPSGCRRAAVEAADLVLCVSRYTRAKVLDWAAIAPERAIVLPNTVREAFTPGSSPLRASLGLMDKRVLLSVGRMDSRERYKGYHRVIAALPRLIAEGHDVAYVLIGEGDDRPQLEKSAIDSGLAGRVRFMGAASQETLVAAYRMADLFVMPSTGEGFGIAYLEAMASGTPAMGLAVAGACDALGDGELGMVVSEDGFGEEIARRLSRPKPDPFALSASIRARFGRDEFSRRAATLFGNLLTPA